MGLFAKVFSSLWEGSMIAKPDVQLVFVFLLAHADREGFVEVTHERVAALTGVPLDRVRAAIAELEAEDPRSRSPHEGGRRLVRTTEHRDWGWHVVNYERYRAMRDEEQRREQAREGMRRLRSTRSADRPVNDPSSHAAGERSRRDDPGSSPSLTVSNVSHGYPPLAHVDVDVDTDTTSTPLRGVLPGAQDGTPANPTGNAAGIDQAGLPTPKLGLQAPPSQRPPYAVLIAAGGKDWPVPEALERELIALYPAVNVPRALMNMRGYLLTNSRRRPTASGMARFVNSWLKKDQDRAAERGTSAPRRGTRGGSDERYEQANSGGGNE